MLTESFLAATLTPEKPINNSTFGIHIYDLQPLLALKSTFKKSSSNPNCIAVNRTHVFAAQADKAVVHVYNRERNNQEAVIPFPERIHSLALAGEKDEAGILVLGTEGGRLILWELGTGRQVSTPQHHLQPITCLAVELTSNFLLSGSSDSGINVWSIPGLLCFAASSRSVNGHDIPFSPLRSLSAHRTAITAVAFGHGANSSNIAVSASEDGTCIAWDHATGAFLHTYLLQNGTRCIAVDPADRAFYVGYEDGSIQLVDLYKQLGSENPLYDPALRAAPSQPPNTDRLLPPTDGDASAVLSLDLCHDGTLLVSGHENGKIFTWDIATRRFQKEVVDFSAPITNLTTLPPAGFPNRPRPSVKLQSVVRPRYESFANGGGLGDVATIPSSYTFTAQFTSDLSTPGSNGSSPFQEALTHASFPISLLEEATAEFGSSRDPRVGHSDSAASEDLRSQNTDLSSQLETALAQQRRAEDANKARDKADWKRKQDEELKAARKKKRRLTRLKAEEMRRKKEMGELVENGDEDMEDQEEEDLSSSTDED